MTFPQTCQHFAKFSSKFWLQEVHGLFLDFFLRTSSVLQSDQESKVTAWEMPDPEEKCCVTIEEWLDVWGFLVGQAKKINDLPMWLQYYPKTLFDTINRSGSGRITKNELRYVWWQSSAAWIKSWSIIDRLMAENISFTPQLLTIHFHVLLPRTDKKLNFVLLWYSSLLKANVFKTSIFKNKLLNFCLSNVLFNKLFQTVFHRLSWCWNSGRGENIEYHWRIIQSDDFQWWCQSWLPHLQTFIPQLSSWKTTQWSWSIHFWISGSEGEAYLKPSTLNTHKKIKLEVTQTGFKPLKLVTWLKLVTRGKVVALHKNFSIDMEPTEHVLLHTEHKL